MQAAWLRNANARKLAEFCFMPDLDVSESYEFIHAKTVLHHPPVPWRRPSNAPANMPRVSFTIDFPNHTMVLEGL